MLDPHVIRSEIESEYAAGGYRLGWRLLASPWCTVMGAKVAFIGLNPGGKGVTAGHGELCMESGSAYEAESWAGHPPGASPLQKQVQYLFQRLRVKPETVLAGNLIPFRSRNAASLGRTKEAIDFGERLWRRILATAKPELVVTMGSVSASSLRRIGKIEHVTTYKVCWGNVTASAGQGENFRLICLPHLSRYTIMDRERSRAALDALFR
jgi:hypothetical protein